MAYRFGRSNWQDVDRLNLLKVCQEHQNWDDRLKAMRDIYSQLGYHPSYFSENSCREELERIIGEPTPNLRLNVSETFVYSRKIVMGKWIDFYEAEVRKKRHTQAELSNVDVRRNVALIQEVMDPKTSKDRLDAILEQAKSSVERGHLDESYRRVIGTLDSAIVERLIEDALKLDVNQDEFSIPPTKPPGEDFDSSTKGYLTPTRNAESYDMSFFSPHKPEQVNRAEQTVNAEPNVREEPTKENGESKMKLLKTAVGDAAPVPCAASTLSKPLDPVDKSMPADIMEPTEPPTREPKQEVDDTEAEADKIAVDPVEQECSDAPISDSPLRNELVPDDKIREVTSTLRKVAVSQSSENASQPSTSMRNPKTPQKTKAPSPQPIKDEDIKKEEASTPSPVPEERVESPILSTKSRGRPRHQSISTSGSITSRKADHEASPEESPEPTPTKRARQDKEPQEPATNNSKKSRNSSNPTSSNRKVKEDTPSSTVSSNTQMTHSESGFDIQSQANSPKSMSEFEAQTETTVRHNLPNRTDRRSSAHLMSARARSRKSQKPDESDRSMSRNSSTSTPARCGPRVPTIPTQTSVINMDPGDLMIFNYLTCEKGQEVYDFRSKNVAPIKMDTAREIEEEKAAAGNYEDAPGNEEDKPRKDQVWTMMVEGEKHIGRELIKKHSFQLADESDYIEPSSSMIRLRRANQDADSNKQTLLSMHRSMTDYDFGQVFKKPVPPTEHDYDSGIYERIDLSMIKREIENGEIVDAEGFFLRCYRMLANAIMFNGFDHDINIYAKNLLDKLKILTEQSDSEDLLPRARRRNRDTLPEKGRESRQEREMSEDRPPSTPVSNRSTSQDPDPDPPNESMSVKKASSRRSQIKEAEGTRKAKKK